MLEDEDAWRPVGEVLEVVERHPEAFEGLEPCASVGIWVSSDTAFFYRSREMGIYHRVEVATEEDLVARGGSGDRIRELSGQKEISDRIAREETYGIFALLTHSGLLNRFVLGRTPDLKGLKVLFLPNVACLGEGEKGRIRDFVRDGGAVVASFESGRYGPDGEPAEDDFFREFLGVEEVQGTFPLEVREEYIRVREPFGSFRPGELIPRPTYALRVVSEGDAEAPAAFLEVTGQHYAPLKGESPHPALILRNYGRGRVVYLPALFGEFYYRYREGRVERLLRDLVHSLLGEGPPVEMEGPPSVVCEVYRKGEIWVVHLVNGSGDMQRPVSLVPVVGIRVRFRDPAVERVHALVSERELEVHKEPDGVWVEVPSMGVYEVLMAE